MQGRKNILKLKKDLILKTPLLIADYLAWLEEYNMNTCKFMEKKK